MDEEEEALLITSNTDRRSNGATGVVVFSTLVAVSGSYVFGSAVSYYFIYTVIITMILLMLLVYINYLANLYMGVLSLLVLFGSCKHFQIEVFRWFYRNL